MGSLRSKSTDTGTDTASAAVPASPPIPTNTTIQQVVQEVAPALSKRVRMAGDVANLTSSPSIAEQSANTRYSPSAVSKAPASQFLAYSSNPSRLSGA